MEAQQVSAPSHTCWLATDLYGMFWLLRFTNIKITDLHSTLLLN